MEFRQLKYFVAVADHQNMTQASAALFVSQPTVSQQMLALERELGRPLFERHADGVRLTEAGHALLPYALRVLQHIDDAIDEIKGPQGEKETLNIGVLPTLTRSILPQLMKQYQRVHPGVVIGVIESSTQRLVRKVNAGDLHIALLDLPLSDPLLHVERLWSEELVLIAPPDFPLASGRIELGDLQNHDFITTEPGYGLRDALFRLTQPSGFNPRITMELTSLGAIIGFVRLGFGISLVPRRTVQLEIETGEIQELPINTAISRDIGVIWRHQRALRTAAQAFYEHIREQCRQGTV